MIPDDLFSRLDQGDTAAVARAITLVENQREGFERVLDHVHGRLGRRGARRIGLTGPPGAGKSSLAERLTRHYRERELRVAVVAVDPTSPFTGGALLGDRIRMESVSLDPGVYIRSMATRGSLGGLATVTAEVCDILDAAGFDRILIETVGVGQTELDIARTAESTVLVLVPESGDGIQALKAGIMEVADIFVVNKADRAGADRLRQEIEVMLGIRRGNAFRHVAAHHRPGAATPRVPEAVPGSEWEPPVLATVATKGEGVASLADALERHHGFLEASGRLQQGRRERLAERTRAVVNRALRQWIWEESAAEQTLAQGMADMEAGRRSPYEVANEILDQVKSGATR